MSLSVGGLDDVLRSQTRAHVALMLSASLMLSAVSDFLAMVALRRDGIDLLFLGCFRLLAVMAIGGITISAGTSPPLPQGEECASLITSPHHAPAVHDDLLKARKRAAHVRSAGNIGVYLVCTCCQLRVGIQALTYEGAAPREGTVSLLLAGVVLLANTEAWLVQRLVLVLTAPECFEVPSLHRHSLAYAHRPGAVCDMCESRGSLMYYCQQCDFDCCPTCFNKKDASTGEGRLRGDRGLKERTHPPTRASLVAQLAKLVRPHAALLVAALVCLALNTAVGLRMPNLQGRLCVNRISNPRPSPFATRVALIHHV